MAFLPYRPYLPFCLFGLFAFLENGDAFDVLGDLFGNYIGKRQLQNGDIFGHFFL
jgi:hypothetical protein